MVLHRCEECGILHDYGDGYAPPANPEVEIARINAERDVKVAQLANRQESSYNETRVEVAEIEADAAVETAAVQAEVIAEVIAAEGEAGIAEGEDGNPEPVIVEAVEPEEPAEAPPPEIDTAPEPPAKRNVWWS